jgi:hypothetical protein
VNLEVVNLEQVAALAAVLVPARAERLLSLALGPDGAIVLAAGLAARPRHERLAAAAAALPPDDLDRGAPPRLALYRRLIRDATRSGDAPCLRPDPDRAVRERGEVRGEPRAAATTLPDQHARRKSYWHVA